MSEQDPRGRRGRCQSWEEVKYVHDVAQRDLAKEINKLARAGWFVSEPECEQSEDEGSWNSKERTYTIKATRDWCICGMAAVD